MREEAPFIALIDDDGHSAQLLQRTLRAEGAPDVRHLGCAVEGQAALSRALNTPHTWPAMVVVDLKAHSGANVEFLERNRALLGESGIPVAVMTQPTDRAGRQRLHDAGAAAVFFRQAERDAYRHEAAGLLSFWARFKRLDTVGM